MEWFNYITDKKNCAFAKFGIKDFDPSIVHV